MNIENTMTKSEMVLNVLKNGEQLTAKQIRHRFKLATNNSARALVSKLRAEGYAIFSQLTTNSKGHVKSKYRFGMPDEARLALRVMGINL